LLAGALTIGLGLTPAIDASAATTNRSKDVYGAAVGADSLINTFVGGPKREQVAYRFRATDSAPLEAIVVYQQAGSGYGGGDLGSLRITLHPDDGSSKHAPAATVLATRSVPNPRQGAGVRHTFPEPPRLVAGRLYHVVFTNVHAAPASNYISLNGLFVFEGNGGTQPGIPRPDWAMLSREPGGAWSPARNGTITPIMSLAYANGRTAGVGYMEVWVRDPKVISKSRRVRQTFRVGGQDRKIASISVRVKRLEGSAGLRIILRRSNGKNLASRKVRAGKIARSSLASWRGSTWVTVRLDRKRTLKAGKRYSIVLKTKSGTRYATHAVRQGSRYGYGSGSFFSDGRAQFKAGTGSAWKSFTAWGSHNPEGDLQFYLR